ncbi:tetratricopeptide repeat protein [Polluticoccus soli]|uniref:tetratricopeptide repeat protein n=1 Tax=Polluticoccus soli TaxID=3034150 RepID=UPI0023E138B9|nr:tetratricopeptide repeat protein [Flavipsychrobacter sp. JY13-12]
MIGFRHWRQVCLFAIINLLVAGNLSAQEPGETPSVAGLKGVEADALYFDAVKARIKGDNAEAERLLEQVIKIKPDAAGAYYDLARLNLPARPDKAVDNIRRALALEQDNKWYRAQYAEILAFKNEYTQSAEIYDKLAAEEKFNEDYLLKSSLLHQRAGDYKKSLAAIDKLIEKTDRDEEMMMQKYQLYLKMNDVEGAAKVVQELIDMNPSEGKFYSLLADIYDNNKQPEKATEVLKKGEQLFPDDPAVQLGIADHYKKKNDTANYKIYVRKALLNKAFDAETQLVLLVNYMQEIGNDAAQRKEALDIAKHIADNYKDKPEVLGVYGDLLSMNNEREKAQEQYKRSLAIDPSRFPVWRNFLFNYSERKYADSLIVYSEKALKLFPNQAVLHMLNGIGYTNKKDYTKAVTSFNRAADMQPEEDKQQLAEIYMYLGDAYNSARQYSESDSAFETALKLVPENPTVLNNYAYYLSVRGQRLDAAEKMSKKSLELSPEQATFMDTYGWILYKQGKFGPAKEYLQKAIDADPQNADGTLFDHLGDVEFKIGNQEKALDLWKKAKEKGSENEQLNKKIQDRKIYE